MRLENNSFCVDNKDSGDEYLMEIEGYREAFLLINKESREEFRISIKDSREASRINKKHVLE